MVRSMCYTLSFVNDEERRITNHMTEDTIELDKRIGDITRVRNE